MSISNASLKQAESMAQLINNALNSYHAIEFFDFFPGGTGTYFIAHILELSRLNLGLSPSSITLGTLGNVAILTESYIDGFDLDTALSRLHNKSAFPSFRRVRNQLYLLVNQSKINCATSIANSPILLHRSAVFDANVDATEYLYSQFFKTIPKKGKRARLYSFLLDFHLPLDIAYLTAELLPPAFVEDHCSLARIASCYSTGHVIASLYGLLEDPLVSFVASVNNSSLTYVQHGGGYMLYKNPLHDLESKSCSSMYYWGLSDVNNNIKPTRFSAVKTYSSTVDSPYIVTYCLSAHPSFECVRQVLEHLSAEIIQSANASRLICSIHPSTNVSVKCQLRQTCADLGIESRISMSGDLNNISDFVIYDCILSTALIERIVLEKPFAIVQTSQLTCSLAPRSNKAEFLFSYLESNSLLMHSVSSLATQKHKLRSLMSMSIDEFLRLSSPVRSLFVDNPSLASLLA